MQNVAHTQHPEQHEMPPQDVIAPTETRERWIEKAAFALYEARRAEFPEAYPLSWDQVTRRERGDFRFMAMASYRRSLPLVKDVLVQTVAMNLANLDGWIWPDCDNKVAFTVADEDRAAYAAQRRQDYIRKAQQLIASIFGYLETDCDTEAQRKITVDRAEGQRTADVMIVSYWRSSRGMGAANHG